MYTPRYQRLGLLGQVGTNPELRGGLGDVNQRQRTYGSSVNLPQPTHIANFIPNPPVPSSNPAWTMGVGGAAMNNGQIPGADFWTNFYQRPFWW